MDVESYFPKLIRASLDQDFQTVRSISMRIVRRIKENHPNLAKEIADALAYHGVGANTKRSVGIEGSPLDSESRQTLARVDEPIHCNRPVLTDKVNLLIDLFIKERDQSSKLISAGLLPPTSILLFGPPGVGKTYLAKYLSGVFQLKFVTLDLATSISSYLGKTGQNLKSVLDYAREEPSLLFLDEFDAVAKKRDDMSDLGELKRIVNVLLKELEDWPPNSVVVAATNHPELLDKAVWRRFDRVIEIHLPGAPERLQLLKSQLNQLDSEKDGEHFLELISELSEGLSSADVCKLAERSKRKFILDDVNIQKAIIEEILDFVGTDDVSFNKKFCKLAKAKTDASIRQLAEWLNKSPSAIQYYLKGGKENG